MHLLHSFLTHLILIELKATFALRGTLVVIYQRHASQNPTDVFIPHSGMLKCRKTELDKLCTSVLRTSVLKCRGTEDGLRSSVLRKSTLMCQGTESDRWHT